LPGISISTNGKSCNKQEASSLCLVELQEHESDAPGLNATFTCTKHSIILSLTQEILALSRKLLSFIQPSNEYIHNYLLYMISFYSSYLKNYLIITIFSCYVISYLFIFPYSEWRSIMQRTIV